MSRMYATMSPQEAREVAAAFQRDIAAGQIPAASFGDSVNFKLKDIEAFVASAKTAHEKAATPEDKRGVSLYFVLNNLPDAASYIKDKASILLVTSSFSETEEGQTTDLDNIIINPDSELDDPGNLFDFGTKHP